MPTILFPLIAASALAHAAWNIALKADADPETAAVRAVILPGAIVGAIAAACWAIGLMPLDALALLLGLAAGVAEVAYFTALARAYAVAPISLVYPVVRGVNPLAAVLVGTLLLGERLSGGQLIGVAALVGGLLLLHRPWRALRRNGARPLAGAPLGAAIAAGLLSALGSSIERVGVMHVGAIEFLGITWAATSLLFFAISSYRGGATHSSPRLFGVGTLMILGHLLVMASFAIAPLSVVVPLRESAVLLVSGWGLVRRREASTHIERARRVIGAATIVGGAAIIAIG